MTSVLGPVQIWAIIGIVLIIIDVFSSTFFLFFLGIGALVTALSVWVGLTPGLVGQLICFSLFSLVATLLFRSALKRMFDQKARHGDYSEYIGQKAVVAASIPAGGEGKVTYRGSEWIAFCEEDREIPEGATVTILSIQGIKLKVG
ncbi:MAG TPA: NfeD family protein [Deltaproteobacteria bacterium]|jgi:membrane protein implicated in regulation of membrane protease activity|nr:NfeD family protein [Deltaproteobacteria bacterium]